MDREPASYIQYITGDDSSEDPRAGLARANGFSEADLSENRQGKISSAQLNRLFGQALRPLRYTGSALLGWLLFVFVIDALVPDLVMTIAAMIGGKSLWAVFGAITMACVAAFLWSVVKSGHTVVLLLQDLSAGQAACLEGKVATSKEDEEGLGMARLHGEQHRKAWYVVKDEYFEVDEAACAALVPGRYRLYYTPKSKLLLSIEPAS